MSCAARWRRGRGPAGGDRPDHGRHRRPAGAVRRLRRRLGARLAPGDGFRAATPGRLDGRQDRRAARLRSAGPTLMRKLLAGDGAGATPAQRADIDNAITVFADEVGGSLPEPWSRTVRAAARSRANEAQAALSSTDP